jgi:hypothetical protein
MYCSLRAPAGNLEGLVINRLRAFLADPGAILDGHHASWGANFKKEPRPPAPGRGLRPPSHQTGLVLLSHEI